jgi:hypothetical protein
VEGGFSEVRYEMIGYHPFEGCAVPLVLLPWGQPLWWGA